MALNKIKLVIITLILFITGCVEKDELTLPVKIHLKIGIPAIMRDDWAIHRCQIGIKRIQFEGIREAGDDVSFETAPEINLQTLEISRYSKTISEFDIPQGIYNYMKWEITLKRIANDELLDSLNPGLVISGMYYWEWGDEPPDPIVFAVDDTVKVSFRSEDNARFVLSENKEYVVILILNPDYVFSISQGEKLETSGDIGQEIILISSNKNEEVYKNILYRIFQTAKVVVE